MMKRIWPEAATGGVLCEKMFLEISQNLQGNICFGVSFLIKLQARPATLLKKILWQSYFPVNFVKFLRAPFLQNTSRWLLLTSAKLAAIWVITLKYYLILTYIGFDQSYFSFFIVNFVYLELLFFTFYLYLIFNPSWTSHAYLLA